MLQEMSYEHFQEWKTFAELEPFDEERADIRAAQITSTMVNMWRNSKKHRKPYSVQEFQLRFGDTPAYTKPRKTWQDLKALAFQVYSGSEAKAA